MGTAHHLHVVRPREVPPRAVAPLLLQVLPVFPVEPLPISVLTSLAPTAVVPQGQTVRVTETTSLRCQEKGCIFPALRGGAGKCAHHHREEREPAMYLSKQPTRAALEHGKFLHLDEELLFGSREADRRRLEAEREAFFET